LSTSVKRGKILESKIQHLKIKKLTSYYKITNNEILDASNNILEINENINKLNNKYYKKVLNILSDFHVVMKQIDDYIAVVDLYHCIAKVADIHKYCKPQIITNKQTNITGTNIRHPLIELINQKIPYCANDININKNDRGMLLYGINYSGKSSYMRSIGIVVIMAQAGFYVAADTFKFTPIRKIFTKIALQDNLFADKSTFLNEIIEIKNIVDNCNNKSLVLADELCSGTEPKSAIALVASVINTLITNKSLFILTSHFHDLLTLNQIKTCKNLKPFYFKVDIDVDNKMIFHRKLIAGITTTEYGIEVARHIGLNSNFIKYSVNIRNQLNNVSQTIKTSNYNSNLYMDKCKICSNIDNLHTHHIVYQSEFDKNDNLNVNNKNVLSNLIVLCESCHILLHQNKININNYIQTSDGVEVK
jgi:DNA mismatch repair protein MutS